MRIEFKGSAAQPLLLCALGLLATVGIAGYAPSAAAQGITVPSVPPMPVSAGAAPSDPNIVPAMTADAAPTPMFAPASVAAIPPGPAGGSDSRSIGMLESKVSDSVKDVVKTLSS